MMARQGAVGNQKLKVGVLGLGQRWQKRYGPALLALKDCFQVQALCDPVQERAVQEARRWGCESAVGPAALLERDDIDALLILEAPWYGLWPIELACRTGKPVFCAPSLAEDDHADALVEQVRRRQLLVMMVMMPRWTPAAELLQDLLASQLGQPRLVVCDFVQPRKLEESILLGSWGEAVIDWCTSLINSPPARILASAMPSAGLASLLLEFADGRAAQIVRRRVPAERFALRLQVSAERGQVQAALPRRVHWQNAAGKHAHILPRQKPMTQVLLERFYQAMVEGQVLKPGLEDAYRALAVLRSATISLKEGRPVQL